MSLNLRLAIPDDIRVLRIFGAEYFIPWEDVRAGCSFFLPTTATDKQVAEVLAPAEEYFGITLAVANRVEYGRYGVRIWRLI